MKRILIALLLACASAQAAMYKHVDANGRVTYTDKPPTTDNTVVIKKQEQSFGSGVSSYPGRSSGSLVPLREQASQRRGDQLNETLDRDLRYWRNRADQASQRYCQYYRDRLSEHNAQWKAQRSRGYKDWEQTNYINRKAKLENDVRRNCQ